MSHRRGTARRHTSTEMRRRCCSLPALVLLLALPSLPLAEEGDSEGESSAHNDVAADGASGSAPSPTEPTPAADPPDAARTYSAEEIAAVNDLVDSAALHLKEHKVNHALTKLERATKLAPSFWRAHFLYGIALEQSYDFDHTNQEPLIQAVSQYSMAHNAEPRHYESVLNRGMAMAKLNRADEALESWHRALRINNNDVRAPFNLGLGYKKLDPPQTSEAVHFFSKALDATPTDAKIYSAIGKTLEEAEPPQLERAASAFLEAHRLDPNRYRDAQEHAMKLQWQAVEAGDPDLVAAQDMKKAGVGDLLPPEPPPVRLSKEDHDL
jgi:tetratricopeptide (TPR) repeat protein